MHELFERRHCVRSFQPRKPSRERLSTILDAANSAPSAGDLRAREIIVVEDETIRTRLVQAALGQDFIAQAPIVLVFWAVPSRSAGKYGERGRDLFCLQDAQSPPVLRGSRLWLWA